MNPKGRKSSGGSKSSRKSSSSSSGSSGFGSSKKKTSSSGSSGWGFFGSRPSKPKPKPRIKPKPKTSDPEFLKKVRRPVRERVSTKEKSLAGRKEYPLGTKPGQKEAYTPDSEVSGEVAGDEFAGEGVPEEGQIGQGLYLGEVPQQSCVGSVAGMFLGFIIFCIAFWPAKIAFADDGGIWPAILSIVLFWTSFNLMGGPLMFLIGYIPVVGQGLRAIIGTINLILAFIWVMILKLLIQYWLWLLIVAALVVIAVIVLKIARSSVEEYEEEEYTDEDAEYEDGEYESGYDEGKEELIDITDETSDEVSPEEEN